MNRVFISYSRRNKAFAERIARDLDDAGLDVWIDFRQIHGGELWEREIYKGLERAEFVVLCMSVAAIQSEWVQREIETAREQGKPIFPVLVDDALGLLEADEDLKWLLDVQYIDFRGEYETAFPKLLQALPGGRRIGAFDDFDPATVPNPFKGLEAFQQRDAAFFFGREELTARALARLRRSSFVAVVGASGSGKSSLVRAGVLPALRAGKLPASDHWPILIFTPGLNPIDALAARLYPLLAEHDEELTLEAVANDLHNPGRIVDLVDKALQGAPEDARILLVIDQFEELFTRSGETERERFIALLLAAVETTRSRARIIVTMRADFFGHLSRYPELAERFEGENLLIVTEMTTANLLRAIEGPVQAVSMRYESGLVDRILDDVKSQPGSLPLLQYALRELFKRRQGSLLTNEAYDEIGGVRQALAQHAESIFTALPQAQQELVRRILLRLIEVGENGEATRRRVPRSELTFRDVDEAEVQTALDVLTAPEARLLIASREIRSEGDPVVWMEISHEALIREWDRFKSWVSSNQENLIYESELRKAAADWESSGREPAYLLTGRRLTRAELWLERAEPTAPQRAFIEASMKQHQEQQEAEQARMQRELELQRAATVRARLAAIAAVVLLVGAGLFLLVVNQQRVELEQTNDELARTNTELENTNDALEAAQTDLIQAQEEAVANADNARRLAVSASAGQSLRDSDGDLALALAAAANTGIEKPPAQAQRTLAEVALAPGTRVLRQLDNLAGDLVYRPDGRRFISSDGTSVALHDTETGEVLTRFADYAGSITALAVDPTGEFLLLALQTGEGISLQVRRLDNNSPVNALAVDARINDLATLQRPDGRLALVAASGDGFVRYYSVPELTLITADGNHLNDSPVTVATASRNGTHVATGAENGSIMVVQPEIQLRLWRRDQSQITGISADNQSAVTALAFNDDASLLVVGFADGSFALLNAQTGDTRSVFTPLDTAVNAVAFLPGTPRFVISGTDGLLRLWSAETARQIQTFELGASLIALAAAPEGDGLATAQANATIRLWEMGEPAVLKRFGPGERFNSMVYSPDGGRVITTSGGTLRVWDADTGDLLRVFDVPAGTGIITGVVYSADGSRIAAGTFSSALLVWDAASFQLVNQIDTSMNLISTLAISPDGSRIVATDSGGTIGLWDVASGERLQTFEAHTSGVLALEFAPDGERFASGGVDQIIRLWDNSGSMIQTFTGHDATVRALAFNVAGDRLLSGAADNSVRMWDIATGREIRRFQGHDRTINGVAFLPPGNRVLSASGDGSLRLWDIETGVEVRRYTITNESGRTVAIRRVATDESGELAVTGDNNGDLRLWALLPTVDDLLEWTLDNRFIRNLTCNEQLAFGIDLPSGPRIGEQDFLATDTEALTAEPGTGAATISLPVGTPLRLLQGPLTVDGVDWWQVCTADDITGWVESDVLASAEAPEAYRQAAGSGG